MIPSRPRIDALSAPPPARSPDASRLEKDRERRWQIIVDVSGKLLWIVITRTRSHTAATGRADILLATEGRDRDRSDLIGTLALLAGVLLLR